MRNHLKRAWRPIGEFILVCLIIVYFVVKFALMWIAAVIMIPFHLIGLVWLLISHLSGGDFEMWDPIPAAITDRFSGFSSTLYDVAERILWISDDEDETMPRPPPPT